MPSFSQQLLAPQIFKKSCSLGLARWFDAKLHNSRSF